MTLPTPQEVLKTLWRVTDGRERGYFRYALRVTYENYDLYGEPQFKPYYYHLYRITRFVEEAGGEDTDVRLGQIHEGIGEGHSIRMEPGTMTFAPDPALPISEVAQVILDCKKAGIRVNIDKNSDLSMLINTAALLVEP